MDPFIEGQVGKGFHTSFLAVLSEMLVAQVRPRYIVALDYRLPVEPPLEPSASDWV